MGFIRALLLNESGRGWVLSEMELSDLNECK